MYGDNKQACPIIYFYILTENKIQISEAAFEAIQEFGGYNMSFRGEMDIKVCFITPHNSCFLQCLHSFMVCSQ